MRIILTTCMCVAVLCLLLAVCWHAHASRLGDLQVCDSTDFFYRGCPSSVHFLNRSSGRHLSIADNPQMKGIAGLRYHIDPHPRFCGSDRFVIFTTTTDGRVDLAIRTADLVDTTT